MYGLGLLKGMYVVLRNFVESYYKPERLVTVQYPEERRPLPPRFRGFPFLIYDDDSGALRCVACQLCAKACPATCIELTMAKGEDGKPAKRPETYTLDLGLCMQCGLCVEACPFAALAMDHDFERAVIDQPEPLRLGIDQLRRPFSYLEQINPEAANALAPKPAKTAAGAEERPAKSSHGGREVTT